MTTTDKNHPSQPSAMVADPGPLPSFASEEELRDFVDTHDLSPYFHQMQDVTNNPPPTLGRGSGRAGSTAPRRPPPGARESIPLDIPAELAVVLRAFASRRGLSLQDLVQTWLVDRIAEERRPYTEWLEREE